MRPYVKCDRCKVEKELEGGHLPIEWVEILGCDFCGKCFNVFQKLFKEFRNGPGTTQKNNRQPRSIR